MRLEIKRVAEQQKTRRLLPAPSLRAPPNHSHLVSDDDRVDQIISAPNDPHLKKAVLQAGASTFIPKQEAGEQLYPAIHTYWNERERMLKVGTDV